MPPGRHSIGGTQRPPPAQAQAQAQPAQAQPPPEDPLPLPLDEARASKISAVTRSAPDRSTTPLAPSMEIDPGMMLSAMRLA